MSASLPKPVPPQEPLPGDCCGTGCIPCVFEIYQEQLEQYREDLVRWERLRAEATAPEPAD